MSWCAPLELSARHLPRIADHSALCATERNIYHRALPGHPSRQRAYFVDRNIGSKADSALARPAHRGMQHAISGKHFQSSVIHSDRNIQRDFFAGIFKIPVKPLFESQLARGDFKSRFRVLVDIHFFRHGGLRHAKFSFVTAQHFFALLRIELRPRKEQATVRSRKKRPDSIEPDFFAQSGLSFNHWHSQARYERPREVRHSAGYPPARPANWPGRQYTNLCWFIASRRSCSGKKML